jgi:hypothetical protein
MDIALYFNLIDIIDNTGFTKVYGFQIWMQSCIQLYILVLSIINLGN